MEKPIAERKHVFNPHNAEFINVRFACPFCQTEVNSGHLPVHAPNFLAIDPADSYEGEDHEATCDDCNEGYWLTMFVGAEDGYVEMELSSEIPNVKIDEISKEELEYQTKQFEAIASNTNFFQTFKSGLEKLRKLNAIDLGNKELNSILKFQIYTGIISTMETFLSDTFINSCLRDKILLKRFVQSYPDFRQRKLEFKEIFNQYDIITDTVKTTLLEIIYHDLRKVREMYRSTFEIDFPDLEEPIRCVLIRHDIIHRNGKTKDGDTLVITGQLVSDAILVIEKFITDIAKKLSLI